jgi:transposase-like protein
VDQRVRRSRYDYTLTFKLAVVERVERGELTCRQAQQHYGIQGAATVRNWLRRHGRRDWSKASLAVAKQDMPVGKKSPSSLTPEQQRIKQLESQLKEAQEKALLFEKVLDVLKRDYGVPVKKPLGKSSPKSSPKGSA